MKILFILLAMISSVFASSDTYTFWVDNATMVDAYWNIFNSMAALFNGANSYTSLLKLVFLLGGFAVFFTGVLKGFQGSNASAGITDFAKYMIIGTTLLTFIYSQKSTMLIKTNTFPSYCTTETNKSLIGNGTESHTGVAVGNIPMVLAWGFTFANEIGRESTNLAKMAFSNVTSDTTAYQSRSDYASYLSGIGNVMSQTLDKIGSNTEYINSGATVGSAMSTFLKDCIYIPASQDSDHGPQTINALKTTGDSRKTINDLMTSGNLNVYKNPTNLAGTTIVSPVIFNSTEPRNLLTTSFGGTRTCEDLWINTINPKLNELENSKAIECQDSLKDLFSPMSVRILTGEANPTISQARSIALNAAISNQLIDSQRDIAIGEVSFASGKSIAEHVTGSIGTGQYMAQMLPYIQMGMRAVLYAFFPFVFVIVLLPGGIKVLLSYLQSLIWIELWTPTAAILDMFMSLVASNKFQSMYNNEGFNPLNGVQTFTDTAMLASVGGYLYASVPALTWLILKGSGQMLGSITGAMGAKMGANMDSRTINQDMSSINQLKAVNDDRRSKGLATISLAEQDYMASNHMALAAAGTFSANESKKDLLMSAAAGKTLNDIASGKGMSDYFNADKNNFNKAIAGTIIDKEVKAEVNARTGQTDLKGDFNKAGVDKVISSQSNSLNAEMEKNKHLYGSGSITDQLNTAEKIGKTAGIVASMSSDTDREYLKKVGVIDKKTGEVNQEKFNEVVQTDSKVKEIAQKTNQQVQELGVEKLVDTGVAEKTMGVETTNAQKNMIEATTGQKLSEGGAKAYAAIKAASEGLNWKADQNFLKRIGINENTSPAEVNKRLERFANVMGDSKDRELNKLAAKFDAVTKEEEVSSYVNQAVETTAKGNNIRKNVQTGIETMAKDKNPAAMAIMEKFNNSNDKEGFWKNNGNLKEAITLLDSTGRKGEAWNKLSGDNTVELSHSANMTSDKAAALNVAAQIKEQMKSTSDEGIKEAQKQLESIGAEQVVIDSGKENGTSDETKLKTLNRRKEELEKSIESNSGTSIDQLNNKTELEIVNKHLENFKEGSSEDMKAARSYAEENLKLTDLATDRDKKFITGSVTGKLNSTVEAFNNVANNQEVNRLAELGVTAAEIGTGNAVGGAMNAIKAKMFDSTPMVNAMGYAKGAEEITRIVNSSMSTFNRWTGNGGTEKEFNAFKEKHNLSPQEAAFAWGVATNRLVTVGKNGKVNMGSAGSFKADQAAKKIVEEKANPTNATKTKTNKINSGNKNTRH